VPPISIEPERYELLAGPAYQFEADRREFFQFLGAGLLVLLATGEAAAQESGSGGRRGGREMPNDLAAWIHINEEGVVSVSTGKVEVGQNARTSLTQAVAEELRIKPSAIRLIMADTDLTPWDMGTVGSRTTPTMAPQLHKAAACLREMLLDRAAEVWKVDRTSLAAADGKVAGPGGKSMSFADLAKGQQLTRAIGADTPVTPAAEWKIAGHDLAKVNGREIVTGRHKYTVDLTRPGMLHARIVRPPSFNAKLASADTAAAAAMPNVTVVRDGDFLGVAAAGPEAVQKAAAAIRAEWKEEAQPGSRDLFTYLRGGGQPLAAKEGGIAGTYTVAYIAHTPLEPRAAVAEWNDGRLTVWTGSQRPFGVRTELAQAFKIPEDRIRVIVPDTGSGYGGKHTGEAAIEAARLAKAAGKPVKIMWTREEEFTWAYFRPAGVIDVRSSAAKDGAITAWEFHNYNSGGSGIESPYNIPNQQHEFHNVKYPLRQGSYRGLAATANHFARESHMDELAHSIGMEPLAFRLKNASDPRLKAVIEAAASRFGWGKPKTREGQGFGISAGFEKGGYVACCAEISVAPGTGRIKVERVAEAFECGAVVNPVHLKNQIEGAVIMGIGGALFESVEFENGRILNPRLSKYRVPRFSDTPPQIEAVLVDRKDLPSAGSGETPIVGIAPAIANALFHATGKRVRSMPINTQRA
jgi:isoquinoline 1-oxidoreductase